MVQSQHGLLHVPSTLIRSLMEKVFQKNGVGEDKDDTIKFDTYPGYHGNIAYLLEQMQKM